MTSVSLETSSMLASRIEICRYRLDNGLAVILVPDDTAPVISYQTWYRVGARDEQPGKTGLAHLLEHLMFDQTANLAAGDFDRRMELAGGETNAVTSADWTCYRDELPASQLELAVALEADRMRNLTLSAEHVATELAVVANERQSMVDDDIEGFLGEEAFRLAFRSHPYRWPTIGWMEDIVGLGPDDVRSFYDTHYAPDTATIVIAGAFRSGDALDSIVRHYGAIPPASRARADVRAEPAQLGERRERFGKPIASAQLMIAWRAVPQADPDWLVLQILREVLADGASSRLYRRLVDTELVLQLQGSVSPSLDPGLFEIYLGLRGDAAAGDVEAMVHDEIAALQRVPPRRDELARAGNRLATFFWSGLETASGKAESLGQYEIGAGDHRLLFRTLERLQTISPDDVVRAAKRYLDPDRRTVVIAEPA